MCKLQYVTMCKCKYLSMCKLKYITMYKLKYVLMCKYKYVSIASSSMQPCASKLKYIAMCKLKCVDTCTFRYLAMSKLKYALYYRAFWHMHLQVSVHLYSNIGAPAFSINSQNVVFSYRRMRQKCDYTVTMHKLKYVTMCKLKCVAMTCASSGTKPLAS